MNNVRVAGLLTDLVFDQYGHILRYLWKQVYPERLLNMYTSVSRVEP